MMQHHCHDAGILILDDQVLNIRVLERIITKAGYCRVVTSTDARYVVDLYHAFKPDMLLLDLHMPHVDGYTVLQQIAALVPHDEYLPVLVLSGDISASAKRRALELGAKDFLPKPIDAVEVLLRIKNLLETRYLYCRLKEQNMELERKVEERTAALEAAQMETLERLARAAEYRDDDTGQHTQRVGTMVARLAQCFDMSPVEIERLRWAAPLHDLGKIGIPDSILLKPGKLDPPEFDVIKKHTHIGAGILAGSQSARLSLAELIALTHHERWDGFGYPHGLRGAAIPIEGRLVAVADVFDALTHARPYKPAWPLNDALREITRQREQQFDPLAVDALLSIINQHGPPV